jgi:hypothetical protein
VNYLESISAPYRYRTWIRKYLPWLLINIGIANKGKDCEAAGGRHEWYNKDNSSSSCYHCLIVKQGQLWSKRIINQTDTP